jgi:hypothetical protein
MQKKKNTGTETMFVELNWHILTFLHSKCAVPVHWVELLEHPHQCSLLSVSSPTKIFHLHPSFSYFTFFWQTLHPSN